MKKRFVLNEGEESLWEELEKEKVVEIRGGNSSSEKIKDSTNSAGNTGTQDGTLARWVLSF